VACFTGKGGSFSNCQYLCLASAGSNEDSSPKPAQSKITKNEFVIMQLNSWEWHGVG